jgi:crotonobetainyl-CoA:carnitine CoA-transferase CaiB-like acyl-CoA transferase
MQNREAVLAILDEAFGAQPMEHWAEEFARHDVWWDPLQTFAEVLADPYAEQAGAFRDIEGSDLRTVATPVDFAGSEVGPAARAPEVGEHTEQVLLELGRSWDDIAGLKDIGVIP